MIKYRILERQTDGTWTPFGVAYDRGGQVVLFVPAWRKHKALEAKSLEVLGEKDYPSQTFNYRWREIQTVTEPVSHPIDLLERAFYPDVIGEFLKIVRSASQKLASLIFGNNWQLVPEYEMGPEAEEQVEVTPPSQRLIMKLTSGSLKDAEVERTSDDKLVITLNRPVPEGSHLKFITETGEELKFKVVRPLNRRGRAIYDLSKVSTESPAFRLVLVEGEESVKRKT